MSILDLFRKSLPPTDSSSSEERMDANLPMSGWRYKIPKNANLPIVNNGLKSGFIPLSYSGEGSGQQFLLPQLIEQAYYMSNVHKSCIKLKVSSVVGAGYYFDGYDENNIKDKIKITDFKTVSFEGGFKNFVRAITKDYFQHNRICVRVKCIGKGLRIYERITPAMVGYNKEKSLYYYSEDFNTRGVTNVYPKFTGQREGVYMITFDGEVDKYAPYAVPDWLSAFPNININSQIPEFHEANMENSIGANLVIRRPKEFVSQKEKEKYYDTLRANKGVRGTGNFILLSGNGMEEVAEVQQLSANQNDKLFHQLRSNTIDDICMAHGVNPVNIGVRTPGSLGANQEAEFAYNLFYSVEVVPAIEHIEECLNYFVKLEGIPYRLFLEENKVIKDVKGGFDVTEKEEEQ